MILYHATNASNLPSILKDGLLPGDLVGEKRNYSEELVSADGFVYLSELPAFHAARCKEETVSILKVEVDEACLYPDEDFIYANHLKWLRAQEKDRQREAGKLEKIRELFSLFTLEDAKAMMLENQRHWEESLHSYSTVAHLSHIKPTAIVDTVTLPNNQRVLGFMGGDASLEFMAILRDIHFTQWTKHLNTLFDSGFEALETNLLVEQKAEAERWEVLKTANQLNSHQEG